MTTLRDIPIPVTLSAHHWNEFLKSILKEPHEKETVIEAVEKLSAQIEGVLYYGPNENNVVLTLEQRNRLIESLARAGWKYKQLAHEFKLSKSSIHRIIMEVREKRQ